MKLSNINLALAAIFMIVLFFTIPTYNRWLMGNIFNPDALIQNQSEHLGVRERQLTKYGGSYQVYMHIADALTKLNAKNVVILLPPNSYLDAQKFKEFRTPEPSEFYYYTGYRAVWANSPDVEQANWVIVTQDKKISLHKIENKQQLNALLTMYKTNKMSL